MQGSLDFTSTTQKSNICKLLILLMHERLQGSFPRRFIKRTHNRNPTFHSYNILGLISPDPVPQNTGNRSLLGKDLRGGSFFFNGATIEQLQGRKKHSVEQYDSPSSLKSSRMREEEPQIRQEKMKGSYMAPRSKSTSKIELDSLLEAESLFSKNKLRNPMNYISQERFMSQNKVGPLVVDLSPYKSSRTISEKQKADYNIITNIPRF